MIEKLIGYVYDEFNCVHPGPLGAANYSGVLYAGPLGVVFLGKLFLFEWTVIINWCDVSKVKHKRNNLLKPVPGRPNINTSAAIVIETQGNAKNGNIDTVYEFDLFHDVHKALEVFQTLHNDSFVDNLDKNENNTGKKQSKSTPTSSSSKSSSKPSPSTKTSLRTNVSKRTSMAKSTLTRSNSDPALHGAGAGASSATAQQQQQQQQQ